MAKFVMLSLLLMVLACERPLTVARPETTERCAGPEWTVSGWSAVVSEDIIAIFNLDGGLKGVDPENGELLWSWKPVSSNELVGEARTSSSSLTRGNRVDVGPVWRPELLRIDEHVGHVELVDNERLTVLDAKTGRAVSERRKVKRSALRVKRASLRRGPAHLSVDTEAIEVRFAGADLLRTRGVAFSCEDRVIVVDDRLLPQELSERGLRVLPGAGELPAFPLAAWVREDGSVVFLTRSKERLHGPGACLRTLGDTLDIKRTPSGFLITAMREFGEDQTVSYYPIEQDLSLCEPIEPRVERVEREP